jgi:predicted glycosyltransferase
MLEKGSAMAAKILLYSHDTAGLGNISRTLLLARTLREAYPDAAILIVTGSPVIHAFRIPKNVDYIKIPSLDRVDSERYEPRFLSELAAEVTDMRKDILKRTVLGFKPDLMIVDKRPAGVDGELLETLKTLKERNYPTKLVLGVRDILDDPKVTRRSLINNHAFELIERFYDQVWIYGTPEIFDHTREYGYPKNILPKTHYCGYLQRPTKTNAAGGKSLRVLVTTGGGGDGGDITQAYLEGLQNLPRRIKLKTTVMFGPEMPIEKRDALIAKYEHLDDVRFRDFEPDLSHYYARADLVVSMAGYNTVCELLSFGKRAVLVPRDKPVLEQLIRARRLSELGFFDMIEPSELTPEKLMGQVLASLENTTRPMPTIDLGGLSTIRALVQGLMAEQEESLVPVATKAKQEQKASWVA